MRTGKVRELTRNYAVLNLPVAEMKLVKSAKNQIGAAEYLEQNGKSDCAYLNTLFPGGVSALEKKGYVKITKEQIRRDPYKALEEKTPPRTLTPAQQNAVEFIQTDSRRVQLLHGVTGSGKTEIYLTLIANCLKEGKSSIFLVPEISLTPQMLAQLRARFGKNAAILHSGLSAGERFDEWWRLRTGEAKIAIGARSAVFAPLENLGVVIIDEEHDSSYASETAPRYNTFIISTVCFSDTDISYIFLLGSISKPYLAQISETLSETFLISNFPRSSRPRTIFSAAVKISTSLKC
jgi:primosomal protein N'